MKTEFRLPFRSPERSGPRRLYIDASEYRSASKKDWPDSRTWTQPKADSSFIMLELDILPLWPKLAPELSALNESVKQTRDLIDLEEDWDGEGSPGFAQPHVERVLRFLVKHATWLWRVERTKLLPPGITPGPKGSIDVHWKTNAVELLINFPSQSDVPANYYGDNFGGDSVKGTFDLSHENNWIMLWLMGRK